VIAVPLLKTYEFEKNTVFHFLKLKKRIDKEVHCYHNNEKLMFFNFSQHPPASHA